MVSIQAVASACPSSEQEEEMKNQIDDGEVSDAETVYTQACESVMGINKKAISELKSLVNPPPGVYKVF